MLTKLLKSKKFHSWHEDDVVDHWDHGYHKEEQLKLLRLVFDYGEKLNVKYLLIVSGDVHSSGAARITRNSEHGARFATQIISSPIVNDSSGFLDAAIQFISRAKKNVGEFECLLNNYGNSKDKNLANRNFITVYQTRKELKPGIFSAPYMTSHIYFEDKSGWVEGKNDEKFYRTLNKYK